MTTNSPQGPRGGSVPYWLWIILAILGIVVLILVIMQFVNVNVDEGSPALSLLLG